MGTEIETRFNIEDEANEIVTNHIQSQADKLADALTREIDNPGITSPTEKKTLVTVWNRLAVWLVGETGDSYLARTEGEGDQTKIKISETHWHASGRKKK